ncbi:MAG: heavy metal translocating P-type ATPase [Actinomycetota bacterium]|nr:heavy metal translocating P-type ATPase [Actinomycetota bacterium]
MASISLTGSGHEVPDHIVVHELPNRIRCRSWRIRADVNYARRLVALAESDDRVAKIRVVRPAASVSIEWAPSQAFEGGREWLAELLQHADAGSSGLAESFPSIAGAQRPRLVLAALAGGVAVLGSALGVPVPAPVGALIALSASIPIARRAYRSVTVDHRLTLDVLDLTAIILTSLRGSLLAPASIIGLVEIGEAIRERTARVSRQELLDLLESISDTAWVVRGSSRQQIPVEQVRRGDVVVVYPGDPIPVDGRVLEGKAVVDEHELTGESMPAIREEGQLVYASTLVREGHLHIAVEQVGEETRAGRIVQLMRQAPVHDTRIENYAAKLADRIVFPSFLLAGVVLVLTRDPTRAASILISDFLTGIRVSVPTTILAAMTSAAHAGVVIRSGRALEQLAAVDTIVFDKTGTVTQGRPAIVDAEAVTPELNVHDVLQIAATAEQRLTHPVAEAIVGYAADRGITPGHRGPWHYEIGLGVRARIGDVDVLIGSERLLERAGIEVPNAVDPGPRHLSRLYIATDARLRGIISYADLVRPETMQVISQLRDQLGLEIHLLTGDNSHTAQAVGRDLNLSPANVHGELFPEDKATVVQALLRQGRRVAFVGDGINDLPALAYSDVSVSFGGATAVARETADVVLMKDDLSALPTAITQARDAIRLVRQNIAIVVGVNVVAGGAAIFRGLSPTIAAVVHNGTTVVAAGNGLRPFLGKTPGRRQFAKEGS